MTDQPAPEGEGQISREQAVTMLMQDDQPEAAAPVEAAAAPEEQPEVQSTDDGAGEPVEAEAGEEAESQEPETVVNAPHWWTAEQKERFKELPADVQEILAETEGNRERAVSRLKQEAAEARNRAEQEAKSLGDIKSRLDSVLPQAEAAFASKWPKEIDWVATAQEYGVEQAQLLKLQYEQEQQTLQRLKTAREEAEAKAYENFVQAEFAKLPEVAPDLLDPARRKSVADFLLELGLPPEQLKSAGAVELSLAYDAMRWRAAQKAAKAKSAAPKSPPVKTVAPVAAAEPGNTEQREVQRIANRFSQTRDRADAVALIMAKGL